MMKDSCSLFRDKLADLADGTADDAVVQHVSTCSRCSTKARELKAIISTATYAWEDAPQSWVQSVKQLMPESKRILWAKRLNLRAASAARGPIDEFQIVVGVEDWSIRLLATPTATGWIVMGQLPGESWVFDGRESVSISGNRFQFNAPDLSETAFELVGQDAILCIPPISDLLNDDRI